MSDDRVLAKKSDITFFGDIVRSKKGITNSLSLEQVKEGVAELKGATDEWNGDYSEEGGNLVVPSGSLDITENGEYDVVDKEFVNVEVDGGTPISYGPVLNSGRITDYQERIATELPKVFDQIISDGIELYKYEFSIDPVAQKVVSNPVKVTKSSDMPFYQISNLLIIGIDESTINTLAGNLGVDPLNITLLITMGYITTWGFKKISDGFTEYIINLNDITLCINIVFISGIVDFSTMGIPTAFNNPSYCHVTTTD